MEWGTRRWRITLDSNHLTFEIVRRGSQTIPLNAADSVQQHTWLLGTEFRLNGEVLLRVPWWRRRMVRTVFWHVMANPILVWHNEVEEILDHHRREQRWLPAETVERLITAQPSSEAVARARAGGRGITMLGAVEEALRAADQDLTSRAAAQNEATFQAEWRDRQLFFQTIETSPLSEEQARAVVAMDNRVLVVAAAGSGKTSVMVARAAYALERGFVRPEEILMLAFNRAAAAEIRDRLRERLAHLKIDGAGVRIETFHAFGLGILGGDGGRPRIPSWLEGENGYARVAEIVQDLRTRSAEFDRNWELFRILLADSPPLRSPEEFLEQAKDSSGLHRTFGPERFVRSYGERLIANWLFMHGVEYVYERPYPHQVSSAAHGQYRPDFFYPKAGLWHEHWGLGREGLPPPFPAFNGYLKQIAWKREIHRRNRTPLIESTFAEVVFGDGLQKLEAALAEHGISAVYQPERASRLQDSAAEKQLLLLIRTFMTHIKSGALEPNDLAERLSGRWAHLNTNAMRNLLNLFWPIYEEWESRLREEHQIDFEDMLIKAARRVQSGTYLSPFRLILVDEFQDSSLARARLLESLLACEGRFLMAVGDDWQSINRFAGADISVMTKFQELFGKCLRMDLTTTYRSPQGLATLAARFITRNPRQLRKSVQSAIGGSGQLELIETRDAAGEIRRVLDEISEDEAEERSPTAPASVFLLGRYNFDRDLVPEDIPDNLVLEFSTVHAAKGREADYVVLPQMNSGRYGFPSGVQSSPLLELALSEPDEFPDGEERRLFYVAVTRARRGVILIAREGARSPFFEEIAGLLPVGSQEPKPRRVASRRRADSKKAHGERDASRDYSPEILGIVDDMLAVIREITRRGEIRPHFRRHYIGLAPFKLTHNFVTWQQVSGSVRISIRLPYDNALNEALERLGLNADYDHSLGKWRIELPPSFYAAHRDTFKLVIRAAARHVGLDT